MEKIIMIGGNDPEMAGAVLKALRENAKDAVIYELEKEEMQAITNSRMRRAVSDEMQKHLQDEENRERAREIATQFHKAISVATKSELAPFVERSYGKKLTSMSWKNFNEMLGTLDIFGFIEWFDEKKNQFRIILSDDWILENKRKEVQSMLNLGIGALTEFQSMLSTKKERDKIETIKKKMRIVEE